MYRLKRFSLRALAIVAAGLSALLLAGSIRSFHRSDTVCLMSMAFVSHRGSLYVLPGSDLFDVRSEPVSGAAAWPLLLVPRADWRESEVLGFNGWTDDVFFLLKCPTIAAVVLLLLFAWLCHRRQAEIMPRTHYLACPSCGYLLAAVVHWRCPECGQPTHSRVVEALPARIRPRTPRTSTIVSTSRPAGR